MLTKTRIVLLTVLLALLALGSPVLAQSTYTNPTFGFSARKPGSWHYLTAEQYQENLKGVDVGDPRLKELLTKYARAPFFAVTKYKEPYPDLNPSVSVNVREAGNLKGVPPERALEAIASVFPRLFKDYSVAEGPVATKISGHPAAYLRTNHAMEAQGSSWRITSELWLVPRGELLFVISAGTREDQENGTMKEVRSVVDTIKIK